MKNTITAIIVAIVLIAFALILSNGKGGDKEKVDTSPVTTATQKNITTDSVTVKVDDGNKKNSPSEVKDANNYQIIEITAKGGYTPRKSIAKAGIPTILRFNTRGTFDCSSSVRIPSMGIFRNLPQSGVTDIDLGSQKAGTLQGSCGMGMYPFEIQFQ